jgi:hypothetical protein
MRIFKKSSYLRIIITLIPFGIASLIGGIKQFDTIPNNIDKLEKIQGYIFSAGIGQHYIKELDNNISVYKITLKNENGYYYTELKKDIEILEYKNLKTEDNVIIWTKIGNNSIKKIELNGEILIAYNPPYWMAWFFTLIGILFMTASIYFLVRYSSYYFN